VLIQVLNEISPPNVFSPNGDGINDRWIIQDIDAYKDIEVKIFNRYGVLLLDRKGYDSANAWDGTHNGRNLPVGAYFYVIRTSDDKILKGTVSIIR
jgi:gliding motility-associated-like protein